MRFNQTSLIICLSVTVAFMAGCSTTPKPNPQALPSAQAEPAPPQNPAITAKLLNEDSKSIAVTDIYYKKEGKNLSYIEETRHQSQSSSGPAIHSVITPKTIEVDVDKADSSAIMGGPNTSAFPVKFSNLADPKSTEPGVSSEAPVLGADASQNTSSNSNTQTMKRSGYEAKNEYGELRYLANPIRGLLIKSGYKVVQAKPSAITPNQGDEYFDIVNRIKAGDFGEANFILYGVLSETSLTDNIYDIPGTTSSSQQVSLDVVVDFNVIDSKTSQIVASFIASGVGNEVRIDGKDNGFKHSMAKLMKLASVSLAEDVQKQLAGQNFITAHPGNGPIEGRNFKRRLEDDESTLKVYRK